ARPRPHPPRDALARPDAARLRADVLLRARAGGVRRPAGREADRADVGRRLGRRDPGLPPADDGRRAQDRRRRRRARRDLAAQVHGRPRARGRARPRHPGARRPRAHRRDAARAHGAAGPRRADLRRARRSAPDGRGPPDPEDVRARRALAVRLSARPPALVSARFVSYQSLPVRRAGLTERLARVCSRHPWWTIAAWLVAIVLALACVVTLLPGSLSS